MTRFKEVMATKPQSVSKVEITELLRTIPAREFRFWSNLKATYGERKILAIKAVREQYDLPLKTAKEIVDEIYSGATVKALTPEMPPALLDVMESIESKCQTAARLSDDCGHDMATAIFLNFKQQLHELWLDQFNIPDGETPSDPAEAPK